MSILKDLEIGLEDLMDELRDLEGKIEAEWELGLIIVKEPSVYWGKSNYGDMLNELNDKIIEVEDRIREIDPTYFHIIDVDINNDR